jgi:hypothetical protein
MYSINDEGRQVGGKTGFSSNSQFFHQQLEGIFNGYSTCLAQNQERYIEVWLTRSPLEFIAGVAIGRNTCFCAYLENI